MNLRLLIAAFLLLASFLLLMALTELDHAVVAILSGTLLGVSAITAVAWAPGAIEIIKGAFFSRTRYTRDDLLYVGVWLGWTGLAGLALLSLVLHVLEDIYRVEMAGNIFTGLTLLTITAAATMHLIASDRITRVMRTFNWRSVLAYGTIGLAIAGFLLFRGFMG